jgi:hypothetical protein
MQSSPILGNEVAHFLTFLIAHEKAQWRRGVGYLRLLSWPAIRSRNPPRTIVQGDWSLACVFWPHSSNWKAVSFRLYACRFEKLQRRRGVIRSGHTVGPNLLGPTCGSRVAWASCVLREDGESVAGRSPYRGFGTDSPPHPSRAPRARRVNRPRKPLSRSRSRAPLPTCAGPANRTFRGPAPGRGEGGSQRLSSLPVLIWKDFPCTR